MLTLQGRIVNTFKSPEGVNRATGETYGGSHRVQVMAENLLKTGAVRVQLIDLTVDDPKPFEALTGRLVAIPVGAFVADGILKFFHMRAASTPVSEVSGV
jgi:hypothetical protein